MKRKQLLISLIMVGVITMIGTLYALSPRHINRRAAQEVPRSCPNRSDYRTCDKR